MYPSDRGPVVISACVCRQPPRSRAASRRRALPRGAGLGHGLAGPVPLCCGQARSTVVQLALRDGHMYPRAPRLSGVLGGLSQECCNVSGPPIPAGLGCGMALPTQPVNPVPNPLVLQRVQSFNSAACKKVKNP